MERSRFRSIERVAGGARALSIRTFGRKPSLCIESVLVKFWRNKDASVSRQAGTLLPSSCLETRKNHAPTLRALPQKHARQEVASATQISHFNAQLLNRKTTHHFIHRQSEKIYHNACKTQLSRQNLNKKLLSDKITKEL